MPMQSIIARRSKNPSKKTVDSTEVRESKSEFSTSNKYSSPKSSEEELLREYQAAMKILNCSATSNTIEKESKASRALFESSDTFDVSDSRGEAEAYSSTRSRSELNARHMNPQYYSLHAVELLDDQIADEIKPNIIEKKVISDIKIIGTQINTNNVDDSIFMLCIYSEVLSSHWFADKKYKDFLPLANRV